MFKKIAKKLSVVLILLLFFSSLFSRIVELPNTTFALSSDEAAVTVHNYTGNLTGEQAFKGTSLAGTVESNINGNFGKSSNDKIYKLISIAGTSKDEWSSNSAYPFAVMDDTSSPKRKVMEFSFLLPEGSEGISIRTQFWKLSGSNPITNFVVDSSGIGIVWSQKTQYLGGPFECEKWYNVSIVLPGSEGDINYNTAEFFVNGEYKGSLSLTNNAKSIRQVRITSVINNTLGSSDIVYGYMDNIRLLDYSDYHVNDSKYSVGVTALNNGLPMQNGYGRNLGISFGATITNHTVNSLRPILYAALYKDNTLIGLDADISQEIKAYSSVTLTTNVSCMPEDFTDTHIKLILVENSNLMPYIKPKEFLYNMEENFACIIESKGHPRLLCTPEEWEQNMSLYESGDPYLTKTVSNVIAEADSLLDEPDSEYSLFDGLRLVRTERNIIKSCAFAYAVTGDEKYFDRMYRAVEVTAAWPDWNPSHWLDVAEMSYAYAIAYDLCYDEFAKDETKRQTLVGGLMANGVEQGCETWDSNGSFPNVTSNWQEVCSGGVGIAALAIIDEPGCFESCLKFIKHTVRTLPKGLEAYAPDGAFPEGLAYWEYASKFFFNYLKALSNTLETDYKLSSAEGLSKTGFFPIYSVGPVCGFNYSDSNESNEKSGDACMYYLSELYDDNTFGTYRYMTGLSSGGTLEDFLLYRRELVGDNYIDTLSLDAHYMGEQDVVFARSDKTDDSIWLAFKGGANYTNHGDLDKGSFVFDSQGVRWIMDPGAGEYNSDGYWDKKAGGKRWTLYKKRAESHSTLVINPSNKTNEDQIVNAYAKITKYKTSPRAMYGLIDLTPVYANDVTKATRGIALINNRSEVIIQDKIESSSPAEIYSFFPTKQNIELTDNPKVAYMYNSAGKRIRLDIVSGGDVSWEVMKNVSLATSPINNDNLGSGNTVPGSKLCIHVENSKNPVITVVIRNVYNGVAETEPDSVYDFSEWDNYLK